MAMQVFNHQTDEEVKSDLFRYKIEQGNITPTEFNAMSVEEQQLALAMLEAMHIPTDVAKVLESLEFITVGISIIFFKKIEGIALTTDEQTFYDTLKNLISQHEMNTNLNGWYLPFALQNLLSVKQSRADYKQAKINMTGQDN